MVKTNSFTTENLEINTNITKIDKVFLEIIQIMFLPLDGSKSHKNTKILITQASITQFAWFFF